MAAQFQIGQILQGQGNYDEAIAAFKGYLSKFPNGPQSADAQRAVVDSQLLIAYDLKRREKFADARAALSRSPRRTRSTPACPQVLFEVGQTLLRGEEARRGDRGLGDARRQVPRYRARRHTASSWSPGSSRTRRRTWSGPSTAIARWRSILGGPRRSQRVALMESKALTVVTERAFRSGETPRLKIATRNLPKLTFTAYKIDPETYFRKKRALSGVEALDIGLVAPDAEWTAEVPDYAKYKPIDTTYELKKIEIPGVWVVKVTDEKALQATTLVLGTTSTRSSSRRVSNCSCTSRT